MMITADFKMMKKPILNKNSRGVIFELIAQGSYVKVSAIDTATGTEVSIVGDPSVGQKALQQEAARKLSRVLSKGDKSIKRGKNTSRAPGPPSGWDL